LEDIIKDFKEKAEQLLKNYKNQAEKNINLGWSKKKIKEKDATLFMQLFSVYSDKLMKLADSYDTSNWSEEEKFELNSQSKQYMFKFYKLFNTRQ